MLKPRGHRLERFHIQDPDKYAKALSEAEFVNIMMECAEEYQRTGESVGQSFSRMFQAQTPEGLLLRKAHSAIRQANSPSVVTEQSVSKSDGSAYDRLMEKAERLRAFDPDLTLEQAFAKVYTNPANTELAQQERRENRPNPSTNYPYPGGSTRNHQTWRCVVSSHRGGLQRMSTAARDKCASVAGGKTTRTADGGQKLQSSRDRPTHLV